MRGRERETGDRNIASGPIRYNVRVWWTRSWGMVWAGF